MEFLLSILAVIFGLAPLILLIVLFVRTSSLAARVRQLEARLGFGPEDPPAHAPQSPAPQKKPDDAKPAAPRVQPSPRPTRSQVELEALIGGRLLNRIGAFALVLGVGFFLKYAFDNEWITETMRVVIGIAVGLLCLGGGYRTRTKGFVIFAQGLVGAGIAIFYLSLYASFNFYHLIPQWLAFLLMSGVTILTLVQAIYHDSPAVGILGWAGGFLTPFMLSTGQSNEAALFTYSALLCVGLLAVTMKKESWYALEPLTLVAVFTVFFTWFEKFYTPEDFSLTLFFLLVFWLVFHAADITRGAFKLNRYSELRHVTQSFHAFLSYTALYILFYDHDRAALGSATFAFAILYALSTLAVRRIGSPKGLETRYGATVAVLLLVGTLLEFRDIATVRLLAIEALALFVIGVRFDRPFLIISSFMFFVFALGGFLFGDASLVYDPIGNFSLFSTPRALTAAVIAAMLGVAALTSATALQSIASKARPVLGVAFFLVLFVLLTAETNDFFRHEIHALKQQHGGEAIGGQVSVLMNQRQLAVSVVWLLYSMTAMVVGVIRKATGPRFFAIGLFGLTIVKIFVLDLAFLETLYRIFSFAGLGLILLAVSFIYQRYRTLLFGSESVTDKEPS